MMRCQSCAAPHAWAVVYALTGEPERAVYVRLCEWCHVGLERIAKRQRRQPRVVAAELLGPLPMAYIACPTRTNRRTP